MQATNEQINEAKAYIRMRVDAEQSMRVNLDSLLHQAARKLASVARMYHLSVKQAVNSSNPAIKSRIKHIMNWLMFMIESCVDVLSVAEHKDDKDDILAYIKREQYGRDFQERLNGYINDFIYNTDASNSPSSALKLLTTHAVAEGWMHWWLLEGKRNGAKGFISLRGSSYPCSLCDSNVGYHPIDDYVGLWHPNCKCIFIFI